MTLARTRLEALWPSLYWVLTLVGAVYCVLAIAGLGGIGGCEGTIVACDAASYYYADGYEPVTFTPQFGYSPAFLTAFAPFRLLPFELFVWVWAALHVAGLLWLRAGFMLAIPGVNEDVIRGNITVFIAIAIVLALRHPAAWAFPLLTKVLPGVGMVWHLVRREWRSLVIAIAVTLSIVLVGVAVNRQAWVDWVTLLAGEGTSAAGFLLPRVVLGALVVGYAGLSSRAWLVPVGALVAWSVPWLPAFMVLAAIPRLMVERRTAG